MTQQVQSRPQRRPEFFSGSEPFTVYLTPLGSGLGTCKKISGKSRRISRGNRYQRFLPIKMPWFNKNPVEQEETQVGGLYTPTQHTIPLRNQPTRCTHATRPDGEIVMGRSYKASTPLSNPHAPQLATSRASAGPPDDDSKRELSPPCPPSPFPVPFNCICTVHTLPPPPSSPRRVSRTDLAHSPTVI